MFTSILIDNYYKDIFKSRHLRLPFYQRLPVDFICDVSVIASQRVIISVGSKYNIHFQQVKVQI